MPSLRKEEKGRWLSALGLAIGGAVVNKDEATTRSDHLIWAAQQYDLNAVRGFIEAHEPKEQGEAAQC